MGFKVICRKFLVLSSVLLLVSCSQSKTVGQCDRLLKLAKDSSLMQMLDAWVTDHIDAKSIMRSDLTLGGLKAPGTYFLKSNFDWSILDFNSDISQIRLVGSGVDSFRDGVLVELESVFFTEISGFGFLVNVNGTDLGLRAEEKKYVHFVNDRVSVLCAEYDR